MSRNITLRHCRSHSILLLVFLAFLVPTHLFAQRQPDSAPAGLKNYNDQLVKMLQGYESLLSTAPDKEDEDRAWDSWKVVTRAINEGYLRFSISPQRGTLLDSAQFSAVPESQATHIVVSQGLLDMWDKSPSTTYAVLCLAVDEAATFFSNPRGWFISRRNSLDRFFILIEGYQSVAEFIRDRLVPAGFQLGSYESYILKGYENDRLNSIGLIFTQFSVSMADGLNKARWDFESSGDSVVLRNLLNSLGQALFETRNTLPEDISDNKLFPVAIAIHSWLEFTPEIISRIYNKDRPDDPLNFIQTLEMEPKYAEIRRRLEAFRIKDMPVMEYVFKENLKEFEMNEKLADDS